MPDEQRSGATRDRTDNANGMLAVYVWRGDGTGGGDGKGGDGDADGGGGDGDGGRSSILGQVG